MDDLVEKLAGLHVGQDVTVIDITGARFSGSVVARRPGLDSSDEVGLRRSNGTTHWIKHDRVVAVEA